MSEWAQRRAENIAQRHSVAVQRAADIMAHARTIMHQSGAETKAVDCAIAILETVAAELAFYDIERDQS